MSWKLWLDDQIDDPETPVRHPPDGFIGAKTLDEAMSLVEELGPPDFMDLDHDLGGDDTAMTFIRWLSDNYLDSPPNHNVHSENPVGKQNIISFMESWARSLNGQKDC